MESKNETQQNLMERKIFIAKEAKMVQRIKQIITLKDFNEEVEELLFGPGIVD